MKGEYDMRKETYRSELRKAREALDMSMMELARTLDVNINTIERWEMGCTHPSLANQEKINAFFKKEISV